MQLTDFLAFQVGNNKQLYVIQPYIVPFYRILYLDMDLGIHFAYIPY